MQTYRLNFKGFYDKLFDDTLVEDIDYTFDYADIENLLEGCIETLKTKLDININRAEIVDIQFAAIDGYRAATKPIERKEYLFILNNEKLKSRAQLINAIYHELGHVYQLDRLYNEKLLMYDSSINDLSATTKENVELLKQHLNINNGHTEYWLEYMEKVNKIIKPELAITAYVDEAKELIKEELYERTQYPLNFNGFYDILFNLDEKEEK